MILTNCPNCGAPLRSDGFCEYCKTKIRYANKLEVDVNKNEPFYMELLMQFKTSDGITLVPFQGYAANVIVHNDYVAIEPRTGFCMHMNEDPEIELTFVGHIGKIPTPELKHIKKHSH